MVVQPPRRPVFSQRGSTKKVICHICCWQTIKCDIERIIATLTFSIAHLSSNKKAQIAILRAQFYETILFCLINEASQDINHPRLKVRKFLILQWCIQYRKASFCTFWQSCIHNIDSFALVYVQASLPPKYIIFIYFLIERHVSSYQSSTKTHLRPSFYSMTVTLNDQQTWPTCHFLDSALLSLSDTVQTVYSLSLSLSLCDSNPESL